MRVWIEIVGELVKIRDNVCVSPSYEGVDWNCLYQHDILPNEGVDWNKLQTMVF